MTFSSLLKGRIAERIIITLLERGGFRVTRLGIEELFDEIKLLSRDEYLKLGLPAQLRALPDILIADPRVSWAKMLEIKFRRAFDAEAAKELSYTLTEQRKYWPDAWAVVMIAEPFVAGGRFHQDYIRLIGPGDLSKLTDPVPPIRGEDERGAASRRWESLPMLTKLFYHAHGEDERSVKLANQFWQGADFITTAIKDLRNL
jgi:hypothetical protein